tara:strand:- start:241 stop:795 length:555 start_codon:yes stop_codon:yes gene_type:complete
MKRQRVIGGSYVDPFNVNHQANFRSASSVGVVSHLSAGREHEPQYDPFYETETHIPNTRQTFVGRDNDLHPLFREAHDELIDDEESASSFIPTQNELPEPYIEYNEELGNYLVQPSADLPRQIEDDDRHSSMGQGYSSSRAVGRGVTRPRVIGQQVYNDSQWARFNFPRGRLNQGFPYSAPRPD